MKIFFGMADRDGQTFGSLARGRENNFDFFRLLLAELVIISHSYPLLNHTNSGEPLHQLTGGQRTLGELAVDGFFLMSGFLICMSWERSARLWDYLQKRILRIYPGFLVAVLFSGLVAAPLLSNDRAQYWNDFNVRDFILGGLNLNFATPPPIINGSLWTIRYEFSCYMAVAAMGLVGMYRKPWLVVAATLGCIGLHAAQLHYDIQMPGSRLSWLWCYPGLWPRLASCYLAGVTFYLYRDRWICSAKLAIAAAIALVVAGYFTKAQALPLIVPFCGGYLLFFMAFVPDFGVHHVARRGDLSYGLYLYAMPIQFLLVHWFRPALTPTLLTLAATIFAAGAAFLSWTFVERPCMIKKKASAKLKAEPRVVTVTVEGS